MTLLDDIQSGKHLIRWNLRISSAAGSLNLSMRFINNSRREKFFVAFAETAIRWRRVTILFDSMRLFESISRYPVLRRHHEFEIRDRKRATPHSRRRGPFGNYLISSSHSNQSYTLLKDPRRSVCFWFSSLRLRLQSLHWWRVPSQGGVDHHQPLSQECCVEGAEKERFCVANSRIRSPRKHDLCSTSLQSSQRTTEAMLGLIETQHRTLIFESLIKRNSRRCQSLKCAGFLSRVFGI